MKAYIQKVTPSREASFVFRVKADRRFSRGWHCHPEYELTYIVESRGRRFVGDSVAPYHDGDCVLLGPNLPHTWRSEGGPQPAGRPARLHRAIVVQFQEAVLGSAFWAAPELASIRSLLRRASAGLRIVGRTRDEVARRLVAMRRLSELDRLLELLRILDTIAHGRSEVQAITRQAPTSTPDASQLRKIDKVLAYLEAQAHHQNAVSQSEAARRVRMSPAGFSRFFRRTTGRTFVGYLGELRVSQAALLLMETDLPILEVAMRSGFANLSNFNRRFLALKGMSPRRFRAQHAEAVSIPAEATSAR